MGNSIVCLCFDSQSIYARVTVTHYMEYTWNIELVAAAG